MDRVRRRCIFHNFILFSIYVCYSFSVSFSTYALSGCCVMSYCVLQRWQYGGNLEAGVRMWECGVRDIVSLDRRLDSLLIMVQIYFSVWIFVQSGIILPLPLHPYSEFVNAKSYFQKQRVTWTEKKNGKQISSEMASIVGGLHYIPSLDLVH